jgi:hypothetical protein
MTTILKAVAVIPGKKPSVNNIPDYVNKVDANGAEVRNTTKVID